MSDEKSEAAGRGGGAAELDPLQGLPEHEREEHLLGAYDRVRAKVLAAVERRGGRLSADAVKVLLLVPDIFLLLVRLTLDKDVPFASRALIGSVLAYFISPVDLLPEGIFGGVGFLDDMVLATAVLAQAFGGELEPYARRHWSGPDDIREVLRDVTATARRLLGPRTRERLDRMLEKRGVRVHREEEEAERAGDDLGSDSRSQ
ncbi:MAG TPA: DUF1232 domain-containing protein [Thermoanaerobaculia bacterium]|nr:DUF1232 domain-containing protein [Thermoanaerobaculia bacterium]